MTHSSEQSNPYAPPVGVEDRRARKDRTKIGVVCLWAAVAPTVIGFVSVFLPNSPPLGWFLIAAALFVGAVCLAGKRYRMAAIVGLVLCLFAGGMVTIMHYRQRQEIRVRQQRMQAEQAARAAAVMKSSRTLQSP